MNHLLRLSVAVATIAAALLILLVGLAGHDAELLAPLHLLLFVVAIALYLLPAGLAVYRDCRSALWIAALNIFLGWTIVGWFAAFGWAVGGNIRPLPPAGAPPIHPLPSH